MKLRVLLFALPLLVPFMLESVHSRTSSGDGGLPSVAFVRLAAADPAEAPPASPAPLLGLIANEPQIDAVAQRRADTIGADRRYDILVRHSAWFRSLRDGRECGPIDSSDLKQTCRDSFGPLQPLPGEKIRQVLAAR
jgi:hypothetical protein